MSSRALLLINPCARQGQLDTGELTARLRTLGLDPVEACADGAGAVSEVIRQHRDRVDLVIIGGGDGSLNAAADGLVDARLPLGILPLGTANDLARTLAIPTDLGEACKVIAGGHRQRIDLGSVNGTYFFNAAGLGLTAQITRLLSHDGKSRWGVLAYPLAALRVLWSARPFHAEIRADGAVHRVKAVQIVVGNGRHYGGGLTVAEDATIDDGWLDMYSLEVAHWWQVVALLPALRRGTLERSSSVRTLRGREFEVTTRHPRPITTDGEVTTHTPARFRVVAKALEVFVPRQEEAMAR